MKISIDTFSKCFILLRLLTDLVSIPIILVMAYILKFKLWWVFNTLFDINIGHIYSHAQIEPYISMSFLITLLWILSFYSVGLYERVYSIMPKVEEFSRIVKGVSLATIQVIIITFLFEIIPDSRMVILYTWILGILVISINRNIIASIEIMLMKKGKGVRNTIVIGANEFGQDVAERLILYPQLGYRYCGTLDNSEPNELHYHVKNHYLHLGRISKFKDSVKALNIRAIFVTNTSIPSELRNDILTFSEKNNIDIRVLSDTADIAFFYDIENFDGIPFVKHIRQPSNAWRLLAKRFMDIAASFLGMLLLLPFLLSIAIIIKISSPSGPVIFWQNRVGKNGRVFQMAKFRTMIPNAESKSGPVMVNEENETRYIPIGKWLRKFSLDELPQLWNVFIGDMSLIGPRPERPFFVKQFSREIPYYDLRHQIKGGITGWAQINGRSVLTRQPAQKAKYDLYYIHNWSLSLDLKILLTTVFLVLKGEEAY